MPIELTEQQQRTLDASQESSLAVVDPRTHASYVLVPASEYEALREALDDQREQDAIRRATRSYARGRMDDQP